MSWAGIKTFIKNMYCGCLKCYQKFSNTYCDFCLQFDRFSFFFFPFICEWGGGGGDAVKECYGLSSVQSSILFIMLLCGVYKHSVKTIRNKYYSWEKQYQYHFTCMISLSCFLQMLIQERVNDNCEYWLTTIHF
jgi:hypothetical protein